MPAYAFELMAKLGLDSSEFDSKLSGIGGKIGSGLGTAAKVGAAAIAAATGAIVAFGGASVRTGMSFDSAMSQVAATMGTTVDNIQELRDYAQEMGSSTMFSASQAAEAMNYMALAGYDAETTMSMLPGVLNLAAAGGIDLAAASDMVTDSQTALGLSLEQTSVMIDQMAVASQKSNTSVEQLGDAILTVGGTAKTLSGGTKELSTALGILADNSIKGSEGGTALRNIILSLSAPTDKAAKKMQELGLQVFDAEGQMRPLKDVFGDLNDALSTMTEQEKINVLSDLFNKVDLKSANALLGTTAERWDELAEAIENSAGAAEQMAEVQMDNLAGDITYFKSALEGAQIAISDVLTPSLREFVQFGTDGLSRLTEAFRSGGLEGAISVFSDLVSEGVQMLMNNLPQMINAGAQLLVAIARGIGQNLPLIAQTAVDIIIQLGQGIADHIPDLTAKLPEIIVGIVDFIAKNLPAIFQVGIQIIIALIQGLAQALPQLISYAPQIIRAIVIGIGQAQIMLWECGPEIIQAIGRGVLNSLSALGDLGVQIVTAIAEGILSALGFLGDVIISLFEGGKSAGDAKAAEYRSLGEHAATEATAGLEEGAVDFSGAVARFIASGHESGEGETGAYTGIGTNAATNVTDGWSASEGSFNTAVVGTMDKSFGTAESAAATFTVPGAEAAENLASGVQSGIGAVDGAVSNAMDSAQSSGEAAAAMFGSIGTSMVTETVAGISASAQAVSGAVRGVIQTAIVVGNAATSGATAIGQNIARGIAAGITAGSGAIAAAARSAVQSAVAAAKAAAAISSPSKLFRDEVGYFMGLGVAAGLEDAEDETTKAAVKLARDTYSKAKEWIRRTAKMDRWSLQDELNAWIDVQAGFNEGSQQWLDAEEAIFDIREKMADEFYSDEEKRIERDIKRNNRSAVEQIQLWMELQSKYEKTSEEYVKIDDRIFDLRMDLARDFERDTEKLWKNIADAQEKYDNKLESRIESIAGAYDLFDDVQDRTAVSAEEVTTNLLRQVNVLGGFYDSLDELAARGVSEQMVEEIREMGPQAIDQLQALLSMTDDQLTRYSELYGEKQRIANEQAERELAGFKVDTESTIRENLDNLIDLYEEDGPTIGEALTTGITDGIKRGMSTVVDAAIDMAESTVEAIKGKLGLDSVEWKSLINTSKIPFSESGLGISSAGIINNAIAQSDTKQEYTLNLTMADGSVMAKWMFNPLKDYAAAKGQPIVNAG